MGLKIIYRKFFKSPTLDRLLHGLLNSLTSAWAASRGFYFPQKFNWDWKLRMLRGRYEPETTALFKKIIKPDMTIIDIGAHIGYYTRLAAQLAGTKGQVLAFEPEPDNFQLLSKNVAGRKNIKLFPLAITDQEGEIVFYKVPGSTGCHSVIPQANADPIRVAAITLDSFIAKNKIARVDIIKIDIEGGETKALAGMAELLKNSQNLKIITELSPSALKLAGTSVADFLGQLRAYGFLLFEIQVNGQIRPLPENLSIPDEGSINLLADKIYEKK